LASSKSFHALMNSGERVWRRMVMPHPPTLFLDGCSGWPYAKRHTGA
jgi:hypothetical protein